LTNHDTPAQRRLPVDQAATRFPVGLEQDASGATRVHPLTLIGCAAEGASPEAALEAFAAELGAWLRFAATCGEPVPPTDAELDITVDEWISTEVAVARGASDACFEADLQPLEEGDVSTALRRLGDLRGQLLRAARSVGEARLDELGGEWTARRILDELARAQWWTLSRLGASPLAELPGTTLGRLDTAIALVVDRFTSLPTGSRGTVLDIDGERWTPRKVLRRLLWLEWTMGRTAMRVLIPGPRT
jgi:hypothetical protein